MPTQLLPKDPDAVDSYHIVWCSADNTNDGGTTDTGKLQGATISTSTWTLPAGITEDSSNTDAITIKGVSYAANTVSTITISSGTLNANYDILCRITTSDGRTLDKTLVLPIRSL